MVSRLLVLMTAAACIASGPWLCVVVFGQETELAIPGDAQDTGLPLSEENTSESAVTTPEVAPVSRAPELIFEELPGLNYSIRGLVATNEAKGAIEKAVAFGLPKGAILENRLQLRSGRDAAPWLDDLAAFGFATLQSVWETQFSIKENVVSLKGKASAADKASVAAKLRRAFAPSGLEIQENLEVASRPEARLTLWVTPDRTLVASGGVPIGSEASVRELLIKHLPLGARLVDDVVADRMVTSIPWMRELDAFLPTFFKNAQRNRLRLNGSEVRVEGIAKSADLRTVRSLLEKSFPSPRFKAIADIQLGFVAESATVVETELPFDQLVLNTQIYFNSGKSRISQLTRDEKKKLDALGKQWVKENFRGQVYLYGYTDSTGEPSVNAFVSKARCRNVANYLVDQFGIDSDYIEVMGIPEDGSVNENVPESQMRRVEFRLKPGAAGRRMIPRAVVSSDLLKPVRFDDLLKTTKVFFDNRQISLRKPDVAAVELLGTAMLSENPEGKLIIYGYSDGKGSQEANQWVTEERCKSVANALKRIGVPEERMVLRPVLAAQAVVVEEEGEPKLEETAEINAEEEINKEETSNPRRVEFALETEAGVMSLPTEEPGSAPEEDVSTESAAPGEEVVPEPGPEPEPVIIEEPLPLDS